MAKSEKQNDQYSEEEAQRRFEAAVKTALNTPPKPLKDRPKKSGESRAKKPKKKRV